jgi:tRNA(Arg) A34 adenosine deaminase TadA
MPESTDEAMMAHALALAAAAAAGGEAPIGAVIADPATGEIVAAAANAPIALNDPTAHAEILALRAAAAIRKNYRLTGLSLFVTLEPCAMCAGAISHARIGRLVYGAADEKGGAVAHGARFFEQPTCHWRPEIVAGVGADAASTLLRDFFRVRREANDAAPP